MTKQQVKDLKKASVIVEVLMGKETIILLPDVDKKTCIMHSAFTPEKTIEVLKGLIYNISKQHNL